MTRVIDKIEALVYKTDKKIGIKYNQNITKSDVETINYKTEDFHLLYV